MLQAQSRALQGQQRCAAPRNAAPASVARVATRIARQQAGKATGLAAKKSSDRAASVIARYGNGTTATTTNPMNIVFVSAEVAPWVSSDPGCVCAIVALSLKRLAPTARTLKRARNAAIIPMRVARGRDCLRLG